MTVRLAQAKTGTGKTVAFLVPSIERLARSNPPPQFGQVSILVLSPTRVSLPYLVCLSMTVDC